MMHSGPFCLFTFLIKYSTEYIQIGERVMVNESVNLRIAATCKHHKPNSRSSVLICVLICLFVLLCYVIQLLYVHEIVIQRLTFKLFFSHRCF